MFDLISLHRHMEFFLILKDEQLIWYMFYLVLKMLNVWFYSHNNVKILVSALFLFPVTRKCWIRRSVVATSPRVFVYLCDSAVLDWMWWTEARTRLWIKRSTCWSSETVSRRDPNHPSTPSDVSYTNTPLISRLVFSRSNWIINIQRVDVRWRHWQRENQTGLILARY